jgi:hypothetical protein
MRILDARRNGPSRITRAFERQSGFLPLKHAAVEMLDPGVAETLQQAHGLPGQRSSWAAAVDDDFLAAIRKLDRRALANVLDRNVDRAGNVSVGVRFRGENVQDHDSVIAHPASQVGQRNGHGPS